MRDFLRPQVPVSGTRPPVPQGKTRDILCPQAPAHQSHLPASLAPGSLSLLGFQKALAKKRKKKGKNACFPVLKCRSQAPTPGPAGKNVGYSLSSGAGPRHPLTSPAALPP